MKKFTLLLLAAFVSIAATAQTITIKFNGTNKARNYQVILDDISYYSNSAITPNDNTSVQKEITLSNQQLGSHDIAIYRQRPNATNQTNGNNATPYGKAIYNNTFQLRQDYDMVIAINGNGQVSFSEKRIKPNRPNRGNQNIKPIAESEFNLLVKDIRARYSQATKLSGLRDAFNNPASYFTSEQVRQLLLLINSDANRLTLAKLAYPRVVDASNFTQVYSVFLRVASRNEMDVFIRNNPNTVGNKTGGSNNNTNRTPISDYQFNQLIQTANSQYNQSTRYNTLRSAINTTANYFATSQVRQMLTIINSEADRLALAKLSYLKVTDPAAFTSLSDMFFMQSSRNDLNAYVVQNGGAGTNEPTNTKRTAMADYEFSQLIQHASSQYNQSTRYNTLRNAVNTSNNYFTTTQVRQMLTIISSEIDKLALAKLSYLKVTDPAAFTSLYDMFFMQSSRNDLNAYVVQNGGVGTNEPSNTNRTAMADYEFSQLIQNANSQYNQSTRYNTLRNAVNTSNNYFMTSQVRQMLTIISSEVDRLALAKLSFLKVIDPAAFTSVYDLFFMQSSKNELNAYVVQNGGAGSNTTYSNRQPMDDANFQTLLREANDHILPWNKTSDVKAALSSSSFFTTAQIKQLLSILLSETDKLTLAKLGWARVSDPNNYSQLYDLFNSQSNRDELDAYIKARPF